VAQSCCKERQKDASDQLFNRYHLSCEKWQTPLSTGILLLVLFNYALLLWSDMATILIFHHVDTTNIFEFKFSFLVDCSP
jgi:hypothetical protein